MIIGYLQAHSDPSQTGPSRSAIMAIIDSLDRAGPYLGEFNVVLSRNGAEMTINHYFCTKSSDLSVISGYFAYSPPAWPTSPTRSAKGCQKGHNGPS